MRILLVTLLLTTNAFAATDRTLDGKFITSGSALLTLPSSTDTLVGRATTDTMTNKTLTSPVINTPTGIVKDDVGLGNVDNTSDATKDAATATLTNKTMDYNSNTFQNFPTATPNVVGTSGSPTLITAAGGIAFSGSNYSNINYIAGNGSAIDVTANPQIAAGSSNGQRLLLISRSATNTVLLEDGNGLSMNGSWLGGLDSVIEFEYNGTLWVEISRR